MAAPKPPNLHAQVIEQFCAAFFAGRGVDYHVNASDRSQVGRFLSPPKGSGAAPSPALIAELPVIFANFVGTDDEFDRKHGLAYLLTKALNRYRAGGKPKVAAPHPKDRIYVEAVQKPFPRRTTP